MVPESDTLFLTEFVEAIAGKINELIPNISPNIEISKNPVSLVYMSFSIRYEIYDLPLPS